jgi:Secretion system C-terminal sorting domain
MKALVTILFSILFFSASANNNDGIKIAPNAKTTNIEVRLTTKKATDATIVITNEAGAMVSTQAVKLANGNNAIVLLDIAKLDEGNYTVTMTAGTEVMTTKFMNLKL